MQKNMLKKGRGQPQIDIKIILEHMKKMFSLTIKEM